MTYDLIIGGLHLRRSNPATRIDAKTLAEPPLYPIVPSAVVSASEEELGAGFPMLLRRIYLEVGNGGFGPGAGMLGLSGGHPDADGRTLLDRYRWLQTEGWKDGLLPLFDWGDAAWSCADASTSSGTVVTADESGFTETRFDLASWFSAWLDGVDLHAEIFEIEEISIINPFTRKNIVVKKRARARGKLL